VELRTQYLKNQKLSLGSVSICRKPGYDTLNSYAVDLIDALSYQGKIVPFARKERNHKVTLDKLISNWNNLEIYYKAKMQTRRSIAAAAAAAAATTAATAADTTTMTTATTAGTAAAAATTMATATTAATTADTTTMATATTAGTAAAATTMATATTTAATTADTTTMATATTAGTAAAATSKADKATKRKNGPFVVYEDTSEPKRQKTGEADKEESEDNVNKRYETTARRRRSKILQSDSDSDQEREEEHEEEKIQHYLEPPEGEDLEEHMIVNSITEICPDIDAAFKQKFNDYFSSISQDLEVVAKEGIETKKDDEEVYLSDEDVLSPVTKQKTRLEIMQAWSTGLTVNMFVIFRASNDITNLTFTCLNSLIQNGYQPTIELFTVYIHRIYTFMYHTFVKRLAAYLLHLKNSGRNLSSLTEPITSAQLFQGHIDLPEIKNDPKILAEYNDLPAECKWAFLLLHMRTRIEEPKIFLEAKIRLKNVNKRFQCIKSFISNLVLNTYMEYIDQQTTPLIIEGSHNFILPTEMWKIILSEKGKYYKSHINCIIFL
jgi:hypothetical protein